MKTRITQFEDGGEAIARLEAENDRLRAALQFYADNWHANMIGSGEYYSTYCFQDPSEELIRDEGRRARAALDQRS